MTTLKLVSTTCAICGKREKKRELYPQTLNMSHVNSKIFSARRTPDRMHYRLVKCLRCGLIFSDPIFDNKKILELYKKSSFNYDTESQYLRKTYGFYLSKALKKNKKTKLLDIGCGNGFFLEEAKEMGVDQVYGVEPGAPSVAKAPKWLRKNIIVDILRPKLFKPNEFDMVTCFQTLDHIPDPNNFITEIKKILKKNGRALFIQHNTNGLSVKLLGEKSPIFDIEHTYLFNKKTLSAIFKKNGFRVISVFDVTNRYPLSYWIRMLPFPVTFKKTLLAGLTILRIESIPIAIKAGNIGIIAEKI